MQFTTSIFGEQPKPKIPENAQVVFVSDMFVSDYVGGAELTTQALIDSSPMEVCTLHSRDVNIETLKAGSGKFWIFGNYSQMNPNLIPSIVGNLRYAIVEYDFKYCMYRSPEKHLAEKGTPCDCHNQMVGKLTSAFFHGATSIWWMSEKQKEKYETMFPFLSGNENYVLSSIFDKTTLEFINSLNEKYSRVERKGWIVLGSNSWIKGTNDAEQWCKDNDKDYEVVWNLPYNDLLDKFAQAEGFVFLPKGGDTCPRTIIEAKLLGCKLQLNDYVLHKDEEWFDTDDRELIESYLLGAPNLFWGGIKKIMDYKPTISGYMTAYNCEKQGYPYKEAISSMATFCDEVCVVDGGSTDGTWEQLQNFKLIFEDINPGKKIVLKQVKRDWDHPRFAVFDGEQKAEARKMCTKEFCWQMDSDEVVHEEDAAKILGIAMKLPKEVDLVSLPVLEYWGGPEKVRLDITPWKWRLSRNKDYITHGIPGSLRTEDSEGNLCALEGTDGCDMIHTETLEPIPFVNFYTSDVDNIRKMALVGNEEARQQYENWFNQVIENLPGVFHYSWFDIERKIKLYRDTWTRHWASLYNKSIEDLAENNMFFDKPWSEVTDEMIKEKAKELSEQTGGHIFHRKWEGQKTPYIVVKRNQPKIMID